MNILSLNLRPFVPSRFAIFILIFSFFNGVVFASSANTLNILFIYADDLGYGDVSCYNSESKVSTPNIDQLARDGIRFTDAHSPSTVCTPSRYSVMTGRMAFRLNYAGVFTGVQGPCLITEDRLTLPQMLQESGYTAALFGKWHIGMTFSDANGDPVSGENYNKDANIPGLSDLTHTNYYTSQQAVAMVQSVDFTKRIPDGPVDRGFDQFFGTACCPTTDWLYAFIDGDRVPVPPARIYDKSPLPVHDYSRDNRIGMIAPGFDMEEVDLLFLDKSKAFLERHAKSKLGQPFFLFHSTQAVHLPSFPANRFKGKTDAGPHGDFIHGLDFIVGELLDTLDQLDLADNTLVILSSDNGPEVPSVIAMRRDYGHDGAKPWRGMKRDQWEGGHCVPFIARWSGRIKAGSVSDQTICQTDIMATCAAITGYELPENAAEDSYNILPALLGEDEGRAIRPYTLHQTIRLGLAIRKGPWKYLDHTGSAGNRYEQERLAAFRIPDSAPDAPGQLYNLDTDPGERTNLYHQHPERVKELKALLEKSKSSGRSRI
ncbi:MAG: arylsulfatase [Opitutales bacterium]|nr:arylsulfatase [Opitutales bacterium]